PSGQARGLHVEKQQAARMRRIPSVLARKIPHPFRVKVRQSIPPRKQVAFLADTTVKGYGHAAVNERSRLVAHNTNAGKPVKDGAAAGRVPLFTEELVGPKDLSPKGLRKM